MYPDSMIILVLNGYFLQRGIPSIINKQDKTKLALDRLKVDSLGLDDTDYNLLKSIIEKFDGGPVGIEAVASSIGEEQTTIEDVYEPYLVKNGFINRTPKGRVATELAYHHFGIEE